MRKLIHTVTEAEDGRRLGTILAGPLALSHHRISSLKFSGGIRLAGQSAHTGAVVHTGQTVEVLLTDGPADLVPYDLPLSIPYRDQDLLIVDKPAPLPAIHSARQDGRTLENAVYAALGCPADFCYRPVSRLDKGTSGLMPVALNAPMHAWMQRLLHTPDYAREYLAVVEGAPPEEAGLVDAPIGHGEGVRRVITPEGKPCRTHYRVLERGKGRSLLWLRLDTGRTHQIRVHMAHLGCPVAGDALYGTALPELPGRFALHSARLAFTHPITGERISLESPMPKELQRLISNEQLIINND